MQRYFGSIVNNKVFLNEDDIYHLTHVMRAKLDECVEIVSNGKVYVAKIDGFNPLSISITKEIDEDNELSAKLILISSLIKGDKMDLVLQKATELGVSSIYLLAAERSVVKIKESEKQNKLIRFNKILKESAQQCKRREIPNVIDIITINDLSKIDADIKLVAYEGNQGSTSSLHEQLGKMNKDSSIAILVGPEGGFTLKEIEIANKNGYNNISLGKRILRAETACFYALSVVSCYLDK